MWHRPHQLQQQQQQQQCGSADHCSHRPGVVPDRSLGLPSIRRRAPPSPKRAHLHFPPPPNYPPPFPCPSTSKMADEPFVSVPGPSSQADPPWPNMDYSYAYYEPGPPTKHTNVPSKYLGAYREGSYKTRHTYLTRYFSFPNNVPK
ncbi:formin-like protein 14 [Anoplophora glabripennis]|uniref:formin-like protein 14 n=1 Tax=Anoplophora glabripennis TaxID=217634 RepID=UPI000874B062|nr:formin-like protein 14 [Anoplophora glabripennis]